MRLEKLLSKRRHKQALEMFFGMSINELDLSLRAYRALVAAGFRNVRDIDIDELAKRPGIGKKTIEEVEEKMNEIYWFVFDTVQYYK